MCAYVRDHTNADSVLVFRKPRGLALLAQRRCTVFPRGQTDEVAVRYFAEVGVTHLVVDRAEHADNQYLASFVRRHPQCTRVVFRNSRYTVLCMRCAAF